MNKIAFKPHETRGQEIIRILENMGGVNNYNLDGSKGIIAIETKAGNYITNDWDILGLTKLGYKIYTLEEYFEEIHNMDKINEVNTMDKWEYMYVKRYISELTSFLSDFNKYGKDGWELCVYSESNNMAVFKRKIKE